MCPIELAPISSTRTCGGSVLMSGCRSVTGMMISISFFSGRVSEPAVDFNPCFKPASLRRHLADMTSADGLSFLQLEEELRAAEVYLSNPSVSEQHGQPAQDAHQPIGRPVFGAAAFDLDLVCLFGCVDAHALFSRKPKTRPVLSVATCQYSQLSLNGQCPTHAVSLVSQDERRREILSKLSAERQATMRKRQLTPSHPTAADTITQGESNRFNSREERSQLLHKLFSARAMSVDDDDHFATPPSSMMPVFHFDASPDEHALSSPDRRIRGDWASDEDQDELFYASDIVNRNGVYTEHYGSYEPNSQDGQQIMGASIFSRLLARPYDDKAPSICTQQYASGAYIASIPVDSNGEDLQAEKMEAISMLEDSEEGDPRFAEADYIDEYTQQSQEADQTRHSNEYKSTLRSVNISNPVVSKRIEYLAQPRTHAFAEREKQRLMREMESFKECTFQPNTHKPSMATRKKPQLNSSSSRPGTMAFPWLSLSPRRKSFSDRPRYAEAALTSQEKKQSTIQRLHLDGTARYELREQAKERLERERLKADCTFQPQINETSKRLVNMVDYKPIHERVSQLQRTKVCDCQQQWHLLSLNVNVDASDRAHGPHSGAGRLR